MRAHWAERLFGSAWFWASFALIGYGLWTSATLRYREPHAPEPIGHVPAFRLTDQEGVSFGTEELAGSLWIGAWIDDPEADAARAASEAMAHLMRRLVRVKIGAYLVTIGGTTPGTPRPARGRWRVLNGPEEDLAPLRSSLGADARTLVLVDATGRIRGRYGTDAAGLKALLRDFTVIMSLEPRLTAQAGNTKT